MTEDRLKKQIEDILRENNGIYGTTDRIFAACREHFAGLAAARREVAGVGGGRRRREVRWNVGLCIEIDMPYINEDGTLDDCTGEITKCDRCGEVERTKDETFEIRSLWDREIFYRRPKPDIGVLCCECSKAVTPLVYALRDIDELKLFVNNLERAINEKRKQGNKNHQTTAHHACECCERCAQRRP